ncbi:VWA domain-containing protein [Zhongshania aquimaris]|uniref:VWA domain-containing protein n=1 Tax=Zhongshania aquimaris TaxID=2857107 RepID=A0ABS6VUU3_9GAMM|nr:VWA domain-containing protein [Zhongshania aquimaris]MBW2942099.1 VWA domain-containing protein [Zhongshania aquimaris]
MNIAGLELHWIRPELVWTAIPLLICALLLSRQQFQQRSWQKHIDPALLPFLLDGKPSGKPRRSALILLIAAVLTWLALLGPAWEKAPSPLHKNTDGLVVVLDLSPSMLAEDIQPSRMGQARFKLRDILHLRRDGQTGLVVFAGDAFVVAPLTDDVNTLLTLIPGLNPGMMPLPGSNPLAGISLAKDLLDRSGANGRILLISDGINGRQLDGIESFLGNSDYPLSVLAVGTEDGAPIPLPGGGFARDKDGNIIVPALSAGELQSLASAGGGDYRELSLDDSDIKALSVDTATSLSAEADSRTERNYDQWKDAGPWLVLLLLPFALLGFRKSWLASFLPLLLPALLILQPSKANAFEFTDLWQTPDQQAAKILATEPQAAAEKFENPEWKAAAQYRAGDFEAAAQSYSQFDNADGHYNRGNALAKAGKLDEAIAAYQAALEKNPDLIDAQTNKKIVEELKKQQEQNQQQSKDQNQDQNDKQDQQKQNQESQGENNQNQDSESSDSESSESESSDSNENNSQDSPSQNQQGDSQNKDNQNSEQEANQENNSSSDQQENDREQDDGEQASAEQQSEQAKAEEDQARERQEQLAEDYAKQAAEQNEAVQNALQANQDNKTQGQAADKQTAQAAMESDEPLTEEEQAREQWLRKIPDNPGNLLRNKFRYQHLERQQRGEQQGGNEDYAPY